MLGKVFLESEIIGAVPKPLNEKLAWQIGYASAQYLTKVAGDAGFDDPMMRHIVVGRDLRASGPELFDALMKGVCDAGAHVIDVGTVDTPLISFAINFLSCAGGLQTTASHRPANFNGFKIFGIKSAPIAMTTGLSDIRRLAAMASQDKIKPLDGRRESRSLWDPYLDHVRQFLSQAALQETGSPIRVVVDASNGIAGKMVPLIFDNLPRLDIVRLNFDSTAEEYGHDPNPFVESNLTQLQEAIVESNADFGVSFDSDADSCVIVDEKGQPIRSDQLTALLASQFLKDNPGGTIVNDVRSSRVVKEMTGKAGGHAVRSRVGQVFMRNTMIEHNAVFGGDLSGHFYFRDNATASSGVIALISVINMVIARNKPLSTLIAPARRYAQSGELKFKTEDRQAVIDRLSVAYPDARVEVLDGVTIDHGEWWCNVRLSTTEPVLRLNLEGADKDTVKIALGEIARYLGDRVN